MSHWLQQMDLCHQNHEKQKMMMKHCCPRPSDVFLGVPVDLVSVVLACAPTVCGPPISAQKPVAVLDPDRSTIGRHCRTQWCACSVKGPCASPRD